MQDGLDSIDLIDIGMNLTHKSFRVDRDAVVARARAVGVRRLVLTGTSLAASREALALARQFPGQLYATAGVHPHDAAHCDEAALRELGTIAEAPEVVAVGECGLDFNRNFSPHPAQQQIFAAQIELALAVKKPLFLHERDAHPLLAETLDRYRDDSGKLPIPAVVHCFTGGTQVLDAYISRGYYIGITGWICDERRGRDLQEAVTRIPLDRLMLETDSPFLMPRDLKFKLKDARNEPSTLPHIAATVARLMGRPLAEVARAATQNSVRFFSLPA